MPEPIQAQSEQRDKSQPGEAQQDSREPASSSASADNPKPDNKPIESPRQKARQFFLIAVAAVALLVVGLLWWVHSRTYETTDDAQIDGHLHPLSSRVDGTVIAVRAEDNQFVRAGDLLVQLDPTDYQVSLEQAKASLQQAVAQTATQRPNVPITQSSNTNSLETAKSEVARAQAALEAAHQDEASTGAQLRQAQANDDKAQTDLRRYTRLVQKDEVSQTDYDQYLATAKAQAAAVEQQQAMLRSSAGRLEQSRAQLDEQQSRLEQAKRDAPQQVKIREATIVANQAAAASAKSQADSAALRLRYTRIFAPVSGFVTQRSAEIGGQIATAQQLMVIVQTDDLWVTANFRETQLKKVAPGQKVTIHVDALGKDFAGFVEALPAASGDRTSLLPPENATGNYVKIVQRLPVRIRFAKDQPDIARLRPGMSVESKIHLE